MIVANGRTVKEVFDEIMDKLIAQGGPCMIGNSGATTQCVYSDGEGRHCAVGWLLPEYNTEVIEYLGGVRSLYSDFRNKLGVNAGWIKENLSELNALQVFHDKAFITEDLHLLLDPQKVKTYKNLHAKHTKGWYDYGI